MTFFEGGEMWIRIYNLCFESLGDANSNSHKELYGDMEIAAPQKSHLAIHILNTTPASKRGGIGTVVV
ncbi:MAG TPA: hypothetical protein VKA27_15035 [Sunxiuqinia sp.]|nr:hypothetical protein [Sunxiuqinia sp.]